MLKELELVYFRILKELDGGQILAARLKKDGDIFYDQVLAVGKSAASMAAIATAFSRQPREGFVLTKDSHLEARYRDKLWGFECWEADHPLPGLRSKLASERLLLWLEEIRKPGHLLVLLSGGTSSLLEIPAPPLSIEELSTVNEALLASGLPIEDINTLRKHLSLVKGGFLGQAIARRFTKVTQLVMGDICLPELDKRLDLVGSGPFLADPTSVDEARSVLEGLKELLLPAIIAKCEKALLETPKSLPFSASLLADHSTVARLAYEKLGAKAVRHPQWSGLVSEEVSQLATLWAGLALRLQSEGFKGVLVATGEPTVRLGASALGRGGRCQELALRFAEKIAASTGIALLAGSTDGSDGPTPYAGAVVDGSSWPKIVRGPYGEKAIKLLQDHSSSCLLKSVPGAILETGPTGHNLNDIFLLSIKP